MKKTEEAKKSETAGFLEAELTRKIYRRLTKRLHPDVISMTEENEELKALWDRIVGAYRTYNADELTDLEVLVNRALEKPGEAGYAPEYEELEEKIERVERQINDIVTTAPYTYGEILESREKREAQLSQLKEEHAGFVQYLETLTATLTGLLKNAATQFIREMKLK